MYLAVRDCRAAGVAPFESVPCTSR